jgi:hypothetical protein
MEGGEALAESLAAALLPAVGRDAQARAAIRAAREGAMDAVDLEMKLRELARDDPLLGTTLLEEMLAERRPDLALKLAQVLATLLDDEALRGAAVRSLRDAPPEARAVGLMALLGRGEREALDLAASSFVGDAPEARATAGFLLNNAPGSLPPGVRARAEIAARAALDDESAPGRVREEAVTLLGRPGASDADVDRIERALRSPDPNVRGRAVRALFDAEVPIARTRALLEQVAADPTTPEPLREAIRLRLAAAR